MLVSEIRENDLVMIALYNKNYTMIRSMYYYVYNKQFLYLETQPFNIILPQYMKAINLSIFNEFLLNFYFIDDSIIRIEKIKHFPDLKQLYEYYMKITVKKDSWDWERKLDNFFWEERQHGR